MSSPVPTMLTIEATAKETGLSAYFVRQLVFSKKIVHIRAGKKYLINFERFIEFLNEGDDTPQLRQSGIRRIEM